MRQISMADLAASQWEMTSEEGRAKWLLAAGQPEGCCIGFSALAQLRFRQLKPWRQYRLTCVMMLGPESEFQGVQ